MTVGEISPGVRIGTLDGELCSTTAMGVLFEGILRRSPKGRGTNVMGLGLNELMRTKMCCGTGDSDWDSLSTVKFPSCSGKEVGRNNGTLTET